MLEVRLHGRGGQGTVTSAELVALATIEEGKYAQSFPSFGPERRGAPVQAFLRIDEHDRIKIRTEVQTPNIVTVLDAGLIKVVNIALGLQPGGTIVLNTAVPIADIRKEFKITSRLATVNATKIAREMLGRPITNTTMIGALIKATGLVKLESLIGPLEHRFGKEGAKKNIEAMKKAYEQTQIEE